MTFLDIWQTLAKHLCRFFGRRRSIESVRGESRVPHRLFPAILRFYFGKMSPHLGIRRVTCPLDYPQVPSGSLPSSAAVDDQHYKKDCGYFWKRVPVSLLFACFLCFFENSLVCSLGTVPQTVATVHHA